MNKRSCVYTVINYRKEWSTDACYQVDEPWKHSVQFSSVAQSCRLFATPWTTAPPCDGQASCPSPTPRASNSSSLSWWCYPTISSSVVAFSSCLQPFPASGSFQMSWLFASGGQSIGVLASASVLPMNSQDWSPLGWSGWISLQSKGLSRVRHLT